MYFAIYLDESGKVHKGDFTSLCGYLSVQDEWAQFTDKWDRLRIKWNIPPIHMAKIMRADDPNTTKGEWKEKYDEWKDIWRDWRDRMLEEFASLVFHANVACVGSVVDSEAYRRVKLEPDCFFVDQDSNVFALQMAITMALERIQKIDPRPSVQLVIDDDKEHAIDYYRRLNNLRQMLEFKNLPDSMKPRFQGMRDFIHGISFYNDRYHPPLQAADMISYVSRDFKVREKRSLEQSESLYGLLTHSGLNQPKFYPEDRLFRIARSTRQTIEASKNEENCWGL